MEKANHEWEDYISMAGSINNKGLTQDVVKQLFLGVLPERKAELQRIWDQYSPQFNLESDNKPFVMQGGLFKFIEFNHRAMRAFWLASFIAWEGYEAIHAQVISQKSDFTNFSTLVASFENMMQTDNLDLVPFPDGIPEPGTLPDRLKEPNRRAAAELAMFAVGWAILHELRHIQHQQEGTGSHPNDPSKLKHNEEMSCDKFATTFMLECIDDYCKSNGEDIQKVRQKRELGIYFALYTMTLVGLENWDATNDHPAMQDRIDAATGQFRMISNDRAEISDACAHLAFAALWMKYPEAPGPFKNSQ